ncbi:MAG: THUMP domain-containing class I SAM-dependent RNA methyltransferase [Christensenellales bacterium]|jgi:putative N6-adenine-specific DNA methylase
MNMLATSAFGLEALVAEELKALGIQNTRTMDARVFFEGDMKALYEANLWLRCADRVFVIVGSFPAASFNDLFEGVKSLPWEQYLPHNAHFPVKGKSALSKLHSVSDCQAVTKKAIVERLREKHRVQHLDESGPEVIVEVAMLKDTATLCLDASGAGLNRRGYRGRQAEAPIRETLAAALVKLARYRPGRMMWDPFCGSGTIAIEAAMLAQNIAPGMMRSFACEQWPFMPNGIIREAREKAISLRRETGMDIMATDIDERAVKIARQNAQRAGVLDAMHIQRMDVSDIRTKVKNGVFICNPPYGRRMLEQKSARTLYAAAGRVMRSLDGWQSFIITSDEEFERYFGKRADKKRKLYNGSTQCTFYQYYKR